VVERLIANEKVAGSNPVSRSKQDNTPFKGAIQFPLDKPIPYDLIEKIVRFRAEAR
jgi:uncharacterized protein YdhG (YjbR/CyaY superfamily)